jgi:hypothetical protein
VIIRIHAAECKQEIGYEPEKEEEEELEPPDDFPEPPDDGLEPPPEEAQGEQQ